MEKLFDGKNTTRLQLLENELAKRTKGMTVAQHFRRIKSLFAEISDFDADEPIKEAQIADILPVLSRKSTPFF